MYKFFLILSLVRSQPGAGPPCEQIILGVPEEVDAFRRFYMETPPPKLPHRIWRPWLPSDPVLDNKLGIRVFSWATQPDGTIRRTYIDSTIGKIPVKIVKLGKRELNDEGGAYKAEHIRRAAENAIDRFPRLNAYLGRARTGKDTHILFALLTEGGNQPDTLIGYAGGVARSTKEHVTISDVETAPRFVDQDVDKVLTTYVMLDAYRRGFSKSYAVPTRKFMEAVTYLPAAMTAGYTHVGVWMAYYPTTHQYDSENSFSTGSSSGGSPGPGQFSDSDRSGNYGFAGDMDSDDSGASKASESSGFSTSEPRHADLGIAEFEMKLPNNGDGVDVVTRLCYQVLLKIVLFADPDPCSCDRNARTHCFSLIVDDDVRFTFTRRVDSV